MYKVVIGVPTAHQGRQAKFYDYFQQILKPENTFINFAHGQSPAANRNVIIKQSLEIGATHIFFVDDDVLIPQDALMKLLAHDKEIVTGTYLMRNFPHAPIAFTIATSDAKCRFKFLQPGENGLVPIVNCGLGCVLIKTDVFRKLKYPWVTLGECDPEQWNDDISFFNRAREAGYELWLDTTIRAGHMQTVTLWPEYRDGQWYTVYDTEGRSHVLINAATPVMAYGENEFERQTEEQRKAGKIVAEV